MVVKDRATRRQTKQEIDNEVDIILDDIRDAILPVYNPDCTFTTRRHDKLLQERLIGKQLNRIFEVQKLDRQAM